MNSALNTRPRLTVVNNELPEPPYPPDTRAKGFMFDIDVERLYMSKTWLLAPSDLKPWLLRLWVEAWRSIPVGSFDDDDEVISARIEMPLTLFQAHRKTLMRGWSRHDDGLLYHSVITERVLKITTWRENERIRKKTWRDKMSHGTDVGQTGTDNTSSSSTTSSKEEAKASLSDIASRRTDPETDAVPKDAKTPPYCPHQDIIALYHETLPELPIIVATRWVGSTSADWLRTRWREDVRHQSLEFWRRFFAMVRTSRHWMGDNDRGWKADLHWLVKRANFDKVIQRLVEVHHV